MRKIKFHFITILLSGLFISCSDNIVQNNQVSETETLLYNLDGVIESIGGDCSGVQVRTRSLGNIDMTTADKVRFRLSGMSDADLSSISIYYLQNDEIVNLINLANRDEINSTVLIDVDSPGLNTELFSRVTLRSSLCTGQIFFLTFSDLKIYSVTN